MEWDNFPAETYWGSCLVRTDSDRDFLTFVWPRSEQDSSVQSLCRFRSRSMQFCAIDRFHEGACQARSLDCSRGLPLHRHQVTGACRPGRCTLPMAARETNRSHLADIGLL